MTRTLTENRWEVALAFASLVAIALHLLPGGGELPLIVVMIAGGLPLIAQIAVKAFKGNLGADLLAAIALLTAAYLQEYLAAVLIVLMLSGGQALEHYATRRASSVLLALAERMPARAHRQKGERVEEIALEDIQIGDHIVLHPHEACPVDGVVIEGHGSMDESYLTGEPYSVSKAPGTNVLSGAINGEGVLVIRAERLPGDSRYARIMQVMQEAEQRRPRMRRLADRLGAAFAPLALLIAVAAWVVTGDAVRFLAVLVVATPCPLLIAIPITIIGAVSLSARRGIIIKDPVVLERLPTCRTAIFDKTGTLTYGKPELLEVIALAHFTQDKALQLAASLERYSKHPLAVAILRAAKKASLRLLEAREVSEKPGQGLSGEVSGQRVVITHRRKLDARQAALLPPQKAGMECVLLVDEALAAVLVFRDKPRAEGHSFISHLAPHHSFEKVMLISGDRASEVAYLAELLGIDDARAEQTPEQKLAIVREETARVPTLFMGDGINDAPSLTAATVGVAFGQISSATAEAAGAVIMESTLAKVDELLHISMSMRSIALQSAIGGMLLSVIGMLFAAAGYISPVAGALLQEGIDILAIANALRLTWQPQVDADIKE